MTTFQASFFFLKYFFTQFCHRNCFFFSEYKNIDVYIQTLMRNAEMAYSVISHKFALNL